MARRRHYVGLNTNPWVVEEHSKLRSNGGRQVDWDAVGLEYRDPDTLKKWIPPGTFYVEVTPGGKVAPRSGVGVIAALAGKTARFIGESATEEDNRNDALTGYGMLVGVSAYENLMPDAAGGPPPVLPVAYVNEFRANGGVLNLFMSSDSRAG